MLLIYFNEDIEFISKNFYEPTEEQRLQLNCLNIDTLELIFSHPNLRLKDEDHLLSTLNFLYNENSKYSELYKNFNFSFVGEETISEFIEIFDINDIDFEIWRNISIRLKQKIQLDDQNIFNKERYLSKKFECKKDKFDGIINFLRNESGENIQNLIEITSSSILDDNQTYSPYNVCLYEDKDKEKYFETNDEENSWICFDFKDHKISPSNYVIKSTNNINNNHPKTWVLEGSNNKENWVILDEQKDSSYLNGKYLVHTFDIPEKNSNSFRYIRLKQTGANCQDNMYHYFVICSIEFYGALI